MEKERLLTESEVAALDNDASVASPNIRAITIAPHGAPAKEIEADLHQVSVQEA